jgi:ABC-type branched-subunit amino acid transport system permease subunit
VARGFDYWRAVIGAVILLLVLVLPGGLGSLLRGRRAP